MFALIPAVMAHQEVGLFEAIGRTVDLLKGSWWWTFLNMVLATVIAFGADFIGGFLLSVPESAIQAANDRSEPTLEDVASLLGATVGGLTLIIGILMFQLAFTHLVGAQIYKALSARHNALAPPSPLPYPPPPGAIPPPRRPGW